jgi:hypothetical protein
VPTDVVPDALSTTIVEAKVEQTQTDERKRSVVTMANPIGATMVDYVYDRESGLVLPKTQSLIATGSEEPTELDEDGNAVEIEDLNGVLSLKTVRKPVGWFSRTWTSSEFVTFPRVLTAFGFVVLVDKSKKQPFGDFPDHVDSTYIYPGGQIAQVGVYVELTDFSGHYLVTTTEQCRPTVYTGLSATNFQPRGFSWVTPWNSGSVPACLHDEIEISWTTGTDHPVLAYSGGTFTFPATSPVTLTGELTLVDEQSPYMGGWKRVTKTVTLS